MGGGTLKPKWSAEIYIESKMDIQNCHTPTEFLQTVVDNYVFISLTVPKCY